MKEVSGRWKTVCSNKENTFTHLKDNSKHNNTWCIPQGHCIIFLYYYFYFTQQYQVYLGHTS